MTKSNWNQIQENEFKNKIKNFFNSVINSALKKSKDNPLEVGNDLASILKNSDKAVVRMITPRAVKKWASPKTLSKWEKLLQNSQMVLELREIGKSIANSMRPLAGNNFALWVAKVLNSYFAQKNIPLKAITGGKIKKELNKSFIKKLKGSKVERDYKPDIDIVLINNNEKPVAIISAKTTLAERIIQTINWHRYLETLPKEISNIKIFLVTAWDTFETGVNKDRVQELDGVYVCNRKVKEYGNIKIFSKIMDDLKKLY